MDPYRMGFIIGQLTEEELEALKRDEAVITKMLLVPDDYNVFHYKEGDEIEAQTPDGNRIWTIIRNMEVLPVDERYMIIFTLIRRSRPVH